jgi:prolipoprotein diacylglyceryltransferase
LFIYKNKPKGAANGLILGACLVLVFFSRFVIEYFKENQVGFEDQMLINMGQLLSIPFILLGIILIFTRKKTAQNKL